MLKNSLLKLLQLIILFFLGFNTAYAWQTDATQGTLYGKVNISTIPIDYSTWHMDAGCSVTLVRNGIDTQTNSCATFSSTGVFTDSTVVGSTQYDYVVRLNNYNLVDQGSWVDQGHWVDSGSMVDNGYWYTSGWPADDPMCMNYSLCETTAWISDWVWVSNWVWSANWQWVPNIVHVNYSMSTISGQGWAKMPGIIADLTATQGTIPAKVHLNWTTITDATSYEVWRSLTPGGTATQLTTTSAITYAAGTKGIIVGADVLGSSFDDTTVSGTTHYFYTIVSKNILGSAPDSDQATGWGKVPVVISDLAATKGTLANKVGLSWSKNTDATGYEVWRSSTSGGGSAKIATLGILATGYYEDVTVSGMTQYYYTVKTVVDSVASQVSNEAMGFAMIVPLKIIGVTATQGTLYAQSTVTWTADPSAASYDVYRSTAAGTKGAIVGADIIGTSFNDTTVSGETHYFYTVVAKNAMGSAPDSNQATGWSKIPAVVSDLTATQGTLSHKVTLIWTDNPDATEYEVWRSTTPGGVPSYVASTIL